MNPVHASLGERLSGSNMVPINVTDIKGTKDNSMNISSSKDTQSITDVPVTPDNTTFKDKTLAKDKSVSKKEEIKQMETEVLEATSAVTPVKPGMVATKTTDEPESSLEKADEIQFNSTVGTGDKTAAAGSHSEKDFFANLKREKEEKELMERKKEEERIANMDDEERERYEKELAEKVEHEKQKAKALKLLIKGQGKMGGKKKKGRKKGRGKKK